MKNRKLIIVSIIILIIAIGGIFGYNKFLKEKSVEGSKSITITVVDEGISYEKVHKHNTDVDTLGKALDEMGIIEASNSQFGRYVEKVENISADKNKKQWWKFLVNGKACQSGIDETVINDGDKVDITLTTGW